MKYINANNIDKKKLISILNTNICLIGVFNEYCIHCKMMKPEWNKFKNLDIKKKRQKNIYIIEIDNNLLNNLNIDYISKHVNGYPSILLSDNGRFVKEYNNDRTHDNMLKFIYNYINKKTKTKKQRKPKKQTKKQKN